MLPGVGAICDITETGSSLRANKLRVSEGGTFEVCVLGFMKAWFGCDWLYLPLLSGIVYFLRQRLCACTSSLAFVVLGSNVLQCHK